MGDADGDAGERGEELEDLFFEGTDLHGEGRWDEALQRFERCLAIDPAYTDALLGKAMVHLAKGELDAAVACGRRMVELAPEDVLAYTNLSVFCQRAGRIAEAEEAAAKAKMLDWKRQLGGGS